MNALDCYLRDTGEKLSTLAERMKRSPSTITRPLRGERNASMDVALDVERATSGKVSASEFMSICLDARKALPAHTLSESREVA